MSDGSQLNDINMNVLPIDLVIGTGQGFIAGYDTGGFKVTCFSNPDPGYDTGIFWNSGVYYIRTTNTSFANDPNRHTAVRIYAPNSGTHNCTPFIDTNNTGWSFIYLDENGQINDATGLTWADGDAVTSVANKLLIAKIIRDGNNTIQQSDIIDERIGINNISTKKQYTLVINPSNFLISCTDGDFPNATNKLVMSSGYVELDNTTGGDRTFQLMCGIDIPLRDDYRSIRITKVEVFIYTAGAVNTTATLIYDEDITEGGTLPTAVGTETHNIANEYYNFAIIPTSQILYKDSGMQIYAAGIVGNGETLRFFGAKVTYEIDTFQE